MILTIDPDVKASGWALSDPDQDGAPIIAAGAHADPPSLHWHMTAVYIERMEVHRGRSGSVPADLISVSLEAGRWAGILEARGLPRAEYMTAQEWKGSLKKEIHGHRLEQSLTESERAILNRFKGAKRGEVLSAMGINMFVTGRIGRSGLKER